MSTVSAKWVIATDDGMYYSMGGTTWERGTGSLLNGGGGDYCLKVAYGNSTWIAINDDGNLAWSPNGFEWSDASGKLGGNGGYGFNGVAYGEDGSGNPLFVAVGPPNETRTILYSPDGKEWEPADATFYDEGDDEGRCVAFGTDQSGIKLWVASGLGYPSDIMTSRNGREWFPTDVSGDTLRGQGIAFGYDPLGAPLWVIVGWRNTLWSSDGSTWNPSYGHRFGIDVGGGGGGYGVAYNGSLWVAVGEEDSGDSKSIRYSPDGRTWYNADGESFNDYGDGVAYDTSGWIAVGDEDEGPTGKNILYSPDGINWTTGSQIGAIGYGIASTSPPPLQPPPASSSWVIAAADGIYYSTNGKLWGHGIGSLMNGGGGDYCQKVAYGNSTWIAINDDGNLAWSPNGFEWSDAYGSSLASGGDDFGVAHGKDGSGNPLFVAVGGSAYNSTTILYSPDGKDWEPADGTFGSGMYVGSSVAFGTDQSGSPLWVAVGYGSISDIMTSRNGREWFPTDIGSDTLRGKGIAFGYDPLGAPLWVVTGFNNTLWSSNGSTWNESYGVPFGENVGGGGGNGVAYNGSLWVAVGEDSGDLKSIRYSPDGKTWFNAKGQVNSNMYSVAYDTSGWIAVEYNGILYSDNGIHWSTGSDINTIGHGIASTAPLLPTPPKSTISWVIATIRGLLCSVDGTTWLPTYGDKLGEGIGVSTNVASDGSGTWIAVGAFDLSGNTILRSTDGVNWKDTSGVQINIFYGEFPDTSEFDSAVSLGSSIGSSIFSFNGIAYGMNKWFVVGGSNFFNYISVEGIINNQQPDDIQLGSNRVCSTDGGQTWEDDSNPNFIAITGIAFGKDQSNNPIFVEVGLDSSGFLENDPSRIGLINTSNGDSYSIEGGYPTDVAFGYDTIGRPLWVVVGSTINNGGIGDYVPSIFLYSYDAKSWENANVPILGQETGTSFDSIVGASSSLYTSVYYNGSLWVAVGVGRGTLWSSDGKTWNDTSGAQFTGCGTGVSYNNNTWIAVGIDFSGNNVLYSNDGITWNAESGQSREYGFTTEDSISNAPLPDEEVGSIVSLFNAPFGIASIKPMPSPPPLQWVIAAADGLYYSTGGTFWLGGNGSLLNEPGQTPAKVAYNGTTWVAIGNGTLAWSQNGTQWYDASGQLGSDDSVNTYGVAHGLDASDNPLFVAVGKPNNGTTILYSRDGKTWATASGSFGSGGGGYYGSSVAFGTDASGNNLWISVGKGKRDVSCDIKISTNGYIWTDVASPSDLRVGSGTLIGNSVAFGYDPLGAPLWVVTGENTLWSSNGSTWNTSYGSPFGSGDSGYGVAYNGSLWVAVGYYDTNPSTIRYSPDGRTWYDASGTLFTIGGRDVAYNTRWIAVGNTTNNILYSPDGINWSTGSDIGVIGNGIASIAPRPSRPPTSASFTDTSGNSFTTSDVSEWTTTALLALEFELTNEATQVQAQVEFVAPPPTFLPSDTYAEFLASATNPQMIAYYANPTTDPALCTIIPILSTNYVANIALFFPVGKTVSIVLTDGLNYVILTEDTSGFLCTATFNNTTKTTSGLPTRVPVGSTYTVGQYTLTNYGMFGANISGLPPTTTTTTTLPPPPLPCFLKGTRILTPDGYKRVEEIDSGSNIITSDGRKISANIYRFTIEETTKETAPYCIQEGALGDHLPSRDLHVSGNHAIQDATGVWQIPKLLANKSAQIKQHRLRSRVIYYHVECPNYMDDNLIAEGVTAESFNHAKQPIVWTKTESGYARRVQADTHMRVIKGM